jgi:hypothetical protein
MPTPKRYANHAERQAAYRARSAETRRRERKEKGMPPLPIIPSFPGSARWKTLVQQAAAHFDLVQEEMECYYEQRSDNWKESERGEAFLEQWEAVQEVRAAAGELWR